MKKILLSKLLVFGILSISNGQIISSFPDLEISWKCKVTKTQSSGNAEYFTCHYFEDEKPYIFSISTTDLSEKLKIFESNRGVYIQDFLDKVESGSIERGGEIIGRTPIGDLKSVQYRGKTKLDDLVLIECTAAFIHNDTGYLINLVSSSDNQSLESSFKSLISNVELN